jgi:hypothetical protein
MAIDPNGTLLQVAYGGYQIVSPPLTIKESLVYAEPGFTSISPIEFAIDKADQIYFIIRKRSNPSGTTFDDIDSSDFLVSSTDSTIGARLDTVITDFSSSSPYYDSQWEDGLADSKKLIVAINSGFPITSPTDRVRVIDCSVKDNTDDSILFFRVLIDDYSKTFHYISVQYKLPETRNTYSTAGSTLIREVDGKNDFYVLISPFAPFYERTDGGHNFSYPLNTRFYERQETFNKEDFSYQISNYSHRELENDVRVKNVPGFPKMGVIIVDRGADNTLAGLTGDVYVDVEAVGLISEMRDTFRMTLIRA